MSRGGRAWAAAPAPADPHIVAAACVRNKRGANDPVTLW